MAKRNSRPSRPAKKSVEAALEAPAPDPSLPGVEGTTGRFIVLFQDGAAAKGIQSLRNSAGLSSVMKSADFKDSAMDLSASNGPEVIVFDELGVAVVNGDPGQVGAVAAMAADETNNNILAIEPERMMFTCGDASGAIAEYLRGYRDAVEHLQQQLTKDDQVANAQLAVSAAFNDTSVATWGLQATRVMQSVASGIGIRVAILDTGMDLTHPDFVGRPIISQSFVPGQPVQDGHGHGTHCTGTSCGPFSAPPRRYGCAHQASIYIGKVLSNAGSGADSGILAGINWAVANKCRVISMSLGAPVQPGEPFSQVYENVGRRTLAANTLIVAAAGNDSSRPGLIRPVGRPANCPSIMAVGAVNRQFGIASFSNGGLNPNGGKVDIAGPGFDVFSSVRMPTRYTTMSGTSMATPHVAGIAAMWLQARGPSTSAAALWQLLVSNTRPLSLPATDVGSGLVQAP